MFLARYVIYSYLLLTEDELNRFANRQILQLLKCVLEIGEHLVNDCVLFNPVAVAMGDIENLVCLLKQLPQLIPLYNQFFGEKYESNLARRRGFKIKKAI